ncbi:hypothetical protein CHH67_20990 [Paenibacillus campinasensis]|uniref:Uncharacterized protein n=1 Tax=Paenibacillus campinasensis TaxID=66347 RepID=A0A268EIW9_9BACL|nr:hypothetical protein CHH67_20990 [Paenibacillus campinasensis]
MNQIRSGRQRIHRMLPKDQQLTKREYELFKVNEDPIQACTGFKLRMVALQRKATEHQVGSSM